MPKRSIAFFAGLAAMLACSDCGDDGAGADATDTAEVADSVTPDTVVPDATETIDTAEPETEVAPDTAEPETEVAAEVIDDSRAPFTGAGGIGGMIDGRVTVFVIDGLGEVGLAGAEVFASAGGTRVEGVTDQNGRVALVDERLVGPVELEVYREGYSFRRFVGAKAALIVVPLSDLAGPEGYATGAFVGGAGMGALPPVPPGGVRAAIAYPIVRSVIAASPVDFNRARPGSTWLERMAVNGGDVVLDRFRMSVYADQVEGVVLIGGTVAGPELGFPFVVTHVGFGMHGALNGEDVDVGVIEMTAPVSETVTIGLALAPYPNRWVTSWMRLPGGELMPVAIARSTNAASFEAKTVARDGLFAGAHRVFWVESENNAVTRSAAVLVQSDAAEIEADDFLPEPTATIDGLELQTKVQQYVDVRNVLVEADGVVLGLVTLLGDRRGVNAVTRLLPEGAEEAWAAASDRAVTLVDYYARGYDGADAPPGTLAALTTKVAIVALRLP